MVLNVWSADQQQQLAFQILLETQISLGSDLSDLETLGGGNPAIHVLTSPPAPTSSLNTTALDQFVTPLSQQHFL